MKIVIEIPEKTISHIRSDHGHGVKGLRDEDREIVCDAIYASTHYEERQHGEWIEKEDFNQDPYYDCSICGNSWCTLDGTPWQNGMNFCPNCGSDMMKEGDAE